MTRVTVSMTVERHGHEVEVEVTGTVTHDRGEPPTWDCPMGGCPPSSDCEIESVEPDVELTEGEIERAEERLYEAADAEEDEGRVESA